MNHHRQPTGKKVTLFDIEVGLHAIRQLAVHRRYVHAALLENVAVFDDAGASAPASRPIPKVFFELGASIFGLKGGTNLLLKGLDVGVKAVF